MDTAEQYLDQHPNEVVYSKEFHEWSWKVAWLQLQFGNHTGYRTGRGVPPELGAQAEAVARCGLGERDWLVGTVRAQDTAVGPWQVQILQAPTPAVGECIARLLELAPWDREHPAGTTVTLAFRVTGEAVSAWTPPEEQDRSQCSFQAKRGYGFFRSAVSQGSMGDWALKMACPSAAPLTHLELELQNGQVLSLRTEPHVPCAEALARSQAPALWKQVERSLDAWGEDVPVRCVFDVPLLPAGDR